MVGLNHELGRELLWREYPTPMTATFFDRFWDAAVDPEAPPDVAPLDSWADRALGAPTVVEDRFVLLLRSELIKRFPDALVSATKPGPPVERLLPVFRGSMDPDISFFGFTVPLADADDWSIVIAEQPGAPRFGFEVGEAPAGVSHAPATEATSARAGRAPAAAARPHHHPRLGAPAGADAMTDPLDLAALTSDALAADARLTAQVGESRHPLVLLPVRLETRFRDGRAAGPGVPRPAARRRPRPSAVRRRDRRGRGLLARAVAHGHRPRARAAGLDRPGGPVRAGAGGLGGARHDAHQPAVPAGGRGRRRRTPDGRADVPRPGAHRAAQHPGRPPAAHPLDGDRLRAGCGGGGRTGRPITADLAVGPDLSSPLVDDEDDDEVAAVDQAMSWLVDFDTAEEVGMALRLPVSGPVDLLLVTGVRDGSADDGATAAGSSTPSATARAWRSWPRRR